MLPSLLNEIIERHFNIRITLKAPGEWVAIDGKTLCGTTDEKDKHGQRVLLAVTHSSRKILAQRPISPPKSHEIPFDEKWHQSGFETLVTVKRTTRENKNNKSTQEIAYYLSNQSVEKSLSDKSKELAVAIRRHWAVESDNWIRDVTFAEDQVRTKQGNQAQIMASLRTLAIKLFRTAKIKNFQEALDNFADCPGKYIDFLRKVRFL